MLLTQLRRRGPARGRPRHLGNVAAPFRHPARRREIPVHAIVGTVDPTAEFDADFRPVPRRRSPRWQSIAGAHRDGRPLPPIEVVAGPGGYYVVDGRHRVSVARAFGQAAI